MANLKSIKTTKGIFQFEAVRNDFLSANYFKPNVKNGEDVDNLLKVLVLYGPYGKSELINSITPEDFEWLEKPEEVLYGIENTKHILENGGVLIVDNANWCAQRIEQFIKLFLDNDINPHNAQLLIAVNTIECMDYYLRSDQIFLLDNSNSFPGETDTLFSIADFKEVSIGGFDFSAWFNAGRFGCNLPYDYMKKEVGLI